MPASVLTNNGSFMWGDVHSLWEVKSSADANRTNIILKGTEVLRYQWRRNFVNGFLICGNQLRMFRIDRFCVLVSLPINIRNNTQGGPLTLVKCILAELVLQDPDRGFMEGDNNLLNLGDGWMNSCKD